MISLVVCVFMVIAALYWMFVVSDRQHDRQLREREDRYYRLREEFDDDYGDDRDTFYYE